MKKNFKVIIGFFFIIVFPIANAFSLVGDPNNDGAIDIVDALLTAQYYVGINPANFDPDAADVNMDGSVDIVDALLIAQYYVGLIPELPIGTPAPTLTPIITWEPTPPPPGFTPFPEATPAPVATSSVSFSVEMRGALPLEMGDRTNWHGCVLSGNFLYMTSEVSFKIFDVSQPGNPVFSGYCEIPVDTDHQIVIKGNYAYVSSMGGDFMKLLAIDISDPSSPVIVNSMAIPEIYSMTIIGDFLYIGCMSETYIVDISLPSNPVIIDRLGSYSITGIVLNGSYAYLVDSHADTLMVMDISDPANPLSINAVPAHDQIERINLSGDYVYLQGSGNIEAYDISIPSSPVLVSFLETPLTSNHANVIYENVLYVTGYGKIYMVDISNPSSLSLAATVEITNANALSIRNSLGYLVCGNRDNAHVIRADGPQYISVLDFSDPLSPVTVLTIDGTRDISSIKVNNTYAYITDKQGLLKIIDISNPVNPVLKSTVSVENPHNLQVQGNYLYIADGTGGFKVVDVTQPENPVIISSRPTHDRAVDIYIDGSYAYIADQRTGVTVFDISNPGSPVESRSTEGQLRPTEAPTAVPDPTATPIGTPIPMTTTIPTPTPDPDNWEATRLVVKDSTIFLGSSFSPEIKILDAYTFTPVSMIDPYLTTIDNIIHGLELEGDNLYVVFRNDMLRAVNVSDPSAPYMAANFLLNTEVRGNSLEADYPYIFNATREIEVVDISDPFQIIDAGSIEIPGEAFGIAVNNGYLYIPGRYTNNELIIIWINSD
ncbi:MAG: hypothetical protein JXJ04_02870 [Spirochaetales bacterium]|nr:hypothetical protein [Spirochaetales bacterium]